MRSWRYLVRDPVVARSWPLFSLRLAQIAHERSAGRLDGGLCRMIGTLRRRARLPASRHLGAGEIAECVAALKDRGWKILPWQLDEADLVEIRDFVFAMPCYADEKFLHGSTIDPRHIPVDRPRYNWRIADVIRLPAVQRLVADSTLHCLAQDYLGARPLLTGISLWLDTTFAGPYAPHAYHYDNDGPAFLKFFFFITDQNLESGTHAYIQKSHPHAKPAALHLSRSYERRELLDFYGGDSEIVFDAPAGTILAEDTAGFHRGHPPRGGYRILMQFQYALLDIPNPEEFRGGVPRLRIDGLAPEIRPIVRKFFS